MIVERLLGSIQRGGRSQAGSRLGIAGYVLAGVVLLCLVGVRIWDPAPVEAMRMQIFDFYQQRAPREGGVGPVVIVDIDEESLARYGQWPWPRTLLASLVDRLFRMGAVVVAFDVLFAEPDRMSPPLLAESLPGLGADARAVLRSQPSNETVFASVMRKYRVVLARAAVPQATPNAGTPLIGKAAVAEIGGDPRRFLLNYPDVVRSLPALEKAASGLGDITISPERDGVVRRVPLAVNVGGQVVPSFAVEVLRVATGQSAFAIKSDAAGIASIVVGGVAIVTDRNARKWIHYARPGGNRYVPASAVLAGRIARQRIAGKLVLVGTSATGLKDIRNTPLSAALPGVEVHAQLLENILTKANLIRPNYALGAELVMLVAVGLFVMLLTPRIGARATLALAGVVAAALIGGSWYLFSERGILIDVSYGVAGSLAIYAVITFIKYMHEEAGRKEVRSAFAHYLSPALVDRLAEHPEQLKLGGETRHMTIMFSDIRGFTAISERTSAENLTRLVNMIMTRLTDAVLAHNGTIDKYIGDCVMAFWNAPLHDPDQERNACLASLDMIERIRQLNDELPDEWPDPANPPPEIAVGVGLNTGECLVGNMGSLHRFNYSVLGDPVNLSARLEGQSAYYGCPVILGEDTAEQVAGLACLELDLIRVKGKSRPARVFALLGDEAVHDSESFGRLTEAHNRMLAAYRARDWPAAADELERCRDNANGFSLEPLYALYETRIRDFAADEPDDEWDGVYVAAEK